MPPGQENSPDFPRRNLTLRALLLALGFTALSTLWMRQICLILFAANIDNSVPPVPVIAALLLLAVGNGLLQRLRRRGLTREETLFIYAFLVMALPLGSLGVARIFFPCLTALRYFAIPENQFARFAADVPAWFAPADTELIRTLYEGAENGKVPWTAWAPFLGRWSLFFLGSFLIMVAAVTLLRQPWLEQERLTFPVLQIPLSLSADPESERPFFANPLMWVGFGVAFVYDLLNILHAINPAVITPGLSYNLGALFTEKPLNALQSLTLYYRPEIVGLGYLVSLEVSFSIWFFYFLLQAEAVLARLLGYEIAGFPFEAEQSAGAFLALALLLLWGLRPFFRSRLRAAFSGAGGGSRETRWALGSLIVGSGIVLFWFGRSGLPLGVAVAFCGMLGAFGLVYARIRAETGVPSNWVFPWGQADQLLVNLFGSARLAPGGAMAPLTMLAHFWWLHRGYLPSLMAYPLENAALGERTGLSRRSLICTMFLALAVGGVAATWMHFSAYYEYGANVLEQGTTEGGYRVYLALNKFQTLTGLATSPAPPDLRRTIASGGGFLLAWGLMLLRMHFLRFPFHPLGYAMATCYGYLLWAPFLTVWVLKLSLLRLGGVRLYKRLIPAFIGLALGHYFTVGLVGGGLGWFAEDVFRRFHVDLG